MVPPHKSCSICSESYPATEFSYGNKDNRSYCRSCDKAEKAAYSAGGVEAARRFRETERAKGASLTPKQMAEAMPSELSPLARLEKMGFCSCGHWSFSSGLLKCELTIHAQDRNVLYAFVSEGRVVYIGKTVQSLKQRMCGYQNPGPTQSTNIKSNARITELIQAGGDLDIYTLPDNGLLFYGGFHVNLAAGLEDSLIRELKPQWNRSGSN